MGGGIKEMTSSGGHPTVKIVLEKCPRTEKALQELQNYHHHRLEHCTVCGSNEELIDLQHYRWTPAQSQLFKKRIVEWTLEVSARGVGGSGGRGGGGDGLTTHDEIGWSCEGCMAKFEMLALVQRRIADLENQEKEIVSQLKKAIGDHLGVISQPNLIGTEPEVTTSFILEDPLIPTPMMANASSDKDVDFKSVILEEEFLVEDALHQLPDGNGVDDGPGDDDTFQGVDLISEEEETNHSDSMEEDEPSPKKARRCKARATQRISAILQNDDDDENHEYSQTDSDTDSDKTNERELDPHQHIGKERNNQKEGGMSSTSSTSLQKGDKHICNVCGKQVLRLSQHMQIHRSDGQTFSCGTCHKIFSAKRYLTAHRQLVHLKQQPHKCQKCGKGFYKAADLKRHLKMRIPCTKLIKKRKFICPICKGGFTSQGHLTTHTRTVHNGEKRTTCPHPKCNFQYFDQTKLESHLEIYHSQDEEEISCTICNEKFSSVKAKLAHIKSDHTCKFCSKSFPNKAQLDEHQATHHAGDRPYFCSKCGNRFLRKKALLRHLRTTPCNPNRDEMDKARQVMYQYKKKSAAKKGQ